MTRRRTKRKRRLILSISLGSTFILLLGGIVLYSAMHNGADYVPGEEIEGITSELDRHLPQDYPRVAFIDVTEEANIHFTHFGATRTTQLPEDMGSGAAWGDYNNDGWDDLFIGNFSGPIDTQIGEGTENMPVSQLYLNNQDGTFTQTGENAGVAVMDFVNGCSWVDYDNDGWLDLFLTCYKRTYLFQNQKDGTFSDVSEACGIREFQGYWTGIAVADYDLDGHQDIYVCGYVNYEHSGIGQSTLQYNAVVPSSINPSSFGPIKNLLFRNNGNGTFSEVSVRAGVANESGRSLEAIWCDFDDDGWLDLYVANDVSDNALFRNKGDGTFEDVSYNSFVADYRGAMGIGIGDWDNDGDIDMFITHWMAQENALYTNLKSQMNTKGLASANRIKFMDQADRYGLGQIALANIGFATFFFDFDNDGRQDLFIANGSTFQDSKKPEKLISMKDQLLWNRNNDEGFFDVSQVSGAYFSESYVGRGAAFSDYDHDGDLDVVIVNNGQKAKLLRNDGGNSNNWLQVKLVGGQDNKFGLGAKIRLVTPKTTQIRQVGAQGPYLSQNSLVEHFGLGSDHRIDSLVIAWPGGVRETLIELEANQMITVERPKL